jgi:hypothetical protein
MAVDFESAIRSPNIPSLTTFYVEAKLLAKITEKDAERGSGVELGVNSY